MSNPSQENEQSGFNQTTRPGTVTDTSSCISGPAINGEDHSNSTASAPSQDSTEPQQDPSEYNSSQESKSTPWEAIQRFEAQSRCLQQELEKERFRVTRLAEMLSIKTGVDIEVLLERASQPKPELHAIVLRYALEFLVPAPGVISYSHSYGPHSTWLKMIRTLKSASLVCKTWNAATLPVLYGDVVLRRAGQLVAFARTLFSAPQVFTRHLCRLTLYFSVPHSWTSLTRRLITRVMAACPSLSTLSVQGTFPAATILRPELDPTSCGDVGEVQARCFQNLRHLDIYDAFPNPDPGAHESFLPSGAYANMVSLSLFLPNEVDSTWESSVHFPNLKMLLLQAHSTFTDARGTPYRLPRSWDLPRLEALRLRLECSTPLAQNSLTAVELAGKYCQTLRNLAFAGSDCIDIKAQTDVAASCPHLEHLVLAMSKMDARRYGAFETVTNMLQRSKLFLQAITLVDIIIQHADFRSESSSRPRIRLVIPAWKHVRCIDRHAISQVPDLPYLSPKLGLEVNAASGFTLYICGVRGEATGCWIEPAAGWKQIAAICPSSDSGSEYGEDDGDDSETAMTNEDSSSDSWPRDRDERYMGRIDRLYIPTVDSREGSVSSSDEGDPEDGSEEEDVTEEEALAMFESSLDTD